MRIVVISDVHGDYQILRDIALKEQKADIFLCLGDSELPEYMINPFVSVKGNCDHFEDYPLSRIITTPSGNIYCEHGHLRGSVDVDFLKEKDCKVYLFGHTHRHILKEIEGVYFANPGSTTRPRDDSNGTYLIIEAKDNDFSFQFIEL